MSRIIRHNADGTVTLEEEGQEPLVIGTELDPPTAEEIEAAKESYFTPPVVEVPEFISALQGELELQAQGKLEDLYTLVGALPTTHPVSIYVRRAQDWHRNHSEVIGMAQALGLTDEQVDAMFISAKTRG